MSLCLSVCSGESLQSAGERSESEVPVVDVCLPEIRASGAGIEKA